MSTFDSGGWPHTIFVIRSVNGVDAPYFYQSRKIRGLVIPLSLKGVRPRLLWRPIRLTVR